jgi:hypothetical protein
MLLFRPVRFLLSWLSPVLLFSGLAGMETQPPQTMHARQTLVQSLDEEQQRALSFPFSDPERFNWHFVPRTRAGLPLGQLSPGQRAVFHAFLSEFMTPAGLKQAIDVIDLERILGELTNNRDFRDPDKYYLSLFQEREGEGASPWAFRLEGHHLSLNYVMDQGKVVAATPAFFGSNPAVVPRGPERGMQVLRDEEVLARLWVQALSPAKQARAIIRDIAPRDVLPGADRTADLAN